MLTKQDLTNLKDLIGDVVTEKLKAELGENFSERIERIENNTDRAVKIASDTREELVVTQAKVDKHEDQIIELQKVAGLATA